MKKFKNTGSASSDAFFLWKKIPFLFQDGTRDNFRAEEHPGWPHWEVRYRLSAGHLRFFLIFSLIKMINKLIWLGVGFLYRTGAEIGY